MPDSEPIAITVERALAGNLEVVYEGVRYRHWYDCIPDHALEQALG